MTLAEEFNPKHNSIGAIRLIAAALVIVGHAFPYGLFGEDPLIQLTHNQIAIGRLPVDVFFILSGFLLTSSFKSGSWRRYARNRILRIFPAFLACLLACGLIVPTIFGVAPSLLYILRSAPLVFGVEQKIPGLFEQVNFSSDVNSSLWTLPWELYCYISIPLLGFVGLFKRTGALIVLALFWLLFAMQIVIPDPFPGNVVTSPFRLFTFFYTGVVFQLFKERVPMSAWLVVGAIAILACATVLGTWFQRDAGVFYIVAPLPLGYLTLFAAVRLRWHKLNNKTDISYGIYIYGSVVMQSLTALGLNALSVPYPVFLLACFAITLPLATASWFLIEKPAMILRGRAGVVAGTPSVS